jgi:hypothetical protein
VRRGRKEEAAQRGIQGASGDGIKAPAVEDAQKVIDDLHRKPQSPALG